MNHNVEEFIMSVVGKSINQTANKNKINKLIINHKKKAHFVPIRYRIFGGLLQSMNIQFGNFLEDLFHVIIKNESNLKIVEPSGKKNIELQLTSVSDRLIDEYITERQINRDNSIEKFLIAFEGLLDIIFEIEKSTEQKDIKIKHDVDVLFENDKNKLFYLELKYNDNHNTNKFIKINKKFIKTYIGLCNFHKIYDLKLFKPILYYFVDKRIQGNIYIPEKQYIYRGKKLFDEFFQIKYNDIENNDKIKGMFDDLYKKIRYDLEL